MKFLDRLKRRPRSAVIATVHYYLPMIHAPGCPLERSHGQSVRRAMGNMGFADLEGVGAVKDKNNPSPTGFKTQPQAARPSQAA